MKVAVMSRCPEHRPDTVVAVLDERSVHRFVSERDCSFEVFPLHPDHVASVVGAAGMLLRPLPDLEEVAA